MNFDEVDASGDGIEFVFILIGSDDEWGGNVWKYDVALRLAGGGKDAVDIKRHLLSIVSREKMSPMAGFEGTGSSDFKKGAAGG